MMIGNIGAAIMGRNVARRAGHNGLLGAALGLAGSIALRRIIPVVTTAAFAAIARKAGAPVTTHQRRGDGR